MTSRRWNWIFTVVALIAGGCSAVFAGVQTHWEARMMSMVTCVGFWSSAVGFLLRALKEEKKQEDDIEEEKQEDHSQL
ncbi:MAG: hypothetical protein ACOX7F_01215 [Eubacteriales bacterium]|jgi:hypothetical protein